MVTGHNYRNSFYNSFCLITQKETNEDSIPLMREETSDGKVTIAGHYKVIN